MVTQQEIRQTGYYWPLTILTILLPVMFFVGLGLVAFGNQTGRALGKHIIVLSIVLFLAYGLLLLLVSSYA